MVIRGNTRGNPKQLSKYLLDKRDNEYIRILDVDGQADALSDDLHQAIFAMGISAELSKSEKGLYHAQINPAPGEIMNDERWVEAADILGRQLKLEDQRRAIVLHTKKGRSHAHVIWERFDHAKGKMVSDSYSRLAQDWARKEMELAFRHAPTPHRNKHRPELKAAITKIWEQTDTGAAFITTCLEQGYIIGEGVGRTPFIVVDENARSHNLARQVKGVRLKDLRSRLRHEKLPTEKQAIEQAKAANSGGKGGRQKDSQKETSQNKARGFQQNKDRILLTPQEREQFKQTLSAFMDNNPSSQTPPGQTPKQKAAAFKDTKDDIMPPTDRQQKQRQQFKESGQEQTKDIDPRRAAFRKRMQQLDEETQKNKDKGLEYD